MWTYSWNWIGVSGGATFVVAVVLGWSRSQSVQQCWFILSEVADLPLFSGYVVHVVGSWYCWATQSVVHSVAVCRTLVIRRMWSYDIICSVMMSGCPTDASCCVSVESYEVFVIWIVSLEPIEIRSDLLPTWSLHCWSWTAVPVVGAWPTTHRFHRVEYGFRGSTQALKSIYIVITNTRRLFVLAPSFLLPYGSQLWWLCLNFLRLLHILSRYIWNEPAQATSHWEPRLSANRGFWALVAHINRGGINAIFSYTWAWCLCESMEEHSIGSRASQCVSWWTLRHVFKRSKVRVFHVL